MAPHVSIIINTYNRAQSLARTLHSLQYLEYSPFEVVVVNGPSTDDTLSVLQPYEKTIKIGSCSERNLSVSRNIGIAMASGDIVAFIDDDAVPEPEWLTRLVEGYNADEVGGVGSVVYNHTGYEFQTRFIVCDRLGGARLIDQPNPTPYFNFPGSLEYCSHLGTNSSFRRNVLLDIGGFDEEFEYYLDETDVCVRMVDSGHVVKFVEAAFIHHKFLPSHIRNENRVVKNWYSIIKNKAYFSIKNASATHSFEQILAALRKYIDEQRSGVEWAIGQTLLPKSEREGFEETANRAMTDGLQRGLANSRRFISHATLAQHRSDFKRFLTPFDMQESRLTICFLSQDFPPSQMGGIARFTYDLAYAAARRGHFVHVITKGEGHDRVDFEEGVWIHRIVPREFEIVGVTKDAPVTYRNHCYSKTVHGEVRRIHSHHPIDIIEAPIWDVEGLYCVLDDELTPKTVVSLETTLKLAAQAQAWTITADLERAMELERLLLTKATAFHAISHAIVKSVCEEYGVPLKDSSIGLVPLGLRDHRPPEEHRAKETDALTVLFVGRLERRKGVDLLLKAIPRVLGSAPSVQFIFVGDDSIPTAEGPPYKEQFLKRYADSPVIDRVTFTGRISEQELYGRYRECDLFVAPSRYESFGLIFIEAMMFGKPVIGCRAGGMPEIIEHERNGLLIEPDDAEALARAILRLVGDSNLRREFGGHSRSLYEARYTDERMADGLLRYYRSLLASPISEANALMMAAVS